MVSKAESRPAVLVASTTSPEWDDVRAFLAVVRTGTLPGAGRLLGVSAVTVGRRLQTLEASLGLVLFDRHPNRLDLTETGRALAEAGSGMDQAAATFVACAARVAAPEQTPVRLTATGSVSLFLGTHAGRLSGLLAASGVQIEVVTTKTRQDPGAGAADIALRMRRLPDDGPLAARKVGTIAFAVYAARNGNSREMVGLPRTDRVRSQSGWLDRFSATLEAPIRLRVGDVSARHQAVRAGAGAALLPCFLGDADEDLVRVGEPPGELVEDVFLVRHEFGRATSRVRAAMEALELLFGEQGRALSGERTVASIGGRAERSF